MATLGSIHSMDDRIGIFPFNALVGCHQLTKGGGGGGGEAGREGGGKGGGGGVGMGERGSG